MLNRRSFIKASSGVLVAGAATGPVQASSKAPAPSVKLTWLGGATMQIEFNGKTLLTDPCFGDGEKAFVMGDPNEMFDLAKGPNVKTHKRITPFPANKMKAADMVVLSHAHEDHFDQKAAKLIRPDIPFILPPHDEAKIAGKGFSALEPLDWQATRSVTAGEGRIDITALPAAHSENPKIAQILGKGNGYRMVFSQGTWRKSFYWTGDTFGTKTVVEAAASFGSPDLMIAHLGGVGTTGPLGKISMEAADLLPFAAAIKPQHLLSVHHSTYALYLEPISELVRMNDKGNLPLDIIASGSTLLFE